MWEIHSPEIDNFTGLHGCQWEPDKRGAGYPL